MEIESFHNSRQQFVQFKQRNVFANAGPGSYAELRELLVLCGHLKRYRSHSQEQNSVLASWGRCCYQANVQAEKLLRLDPKCWYRDVKPTDWPQLLPTIRSAQRIFSVSGLHLPQQGKICQLAVLHLQARLWAWSALRLGGYVIPLWWRLGSSVTSEPLWM